MTAEPSRTSSSGRSAGGPIKVTHIITDLDVGGAEMVLMRLLERTHGASITADVISLYGPGVLAGRVMDLGVPVRDIGEGLRSKQAVVRAIARTLRQTRPSVVQTWMYHADVLGGLASRRAQVPVVWGLHAAPGVGDERIKLRTRAGLRLAAALSRRVPEHIVCCSHQTRRVHAALGYDESKLRTILNGFEVNYGADGSGRQSLSDELGLPADVLLVGRVGRDHPQKDSATLLRAFARVRASLPETRLVLVGAGFSADNDRLRAEIEDAGVSDGVLLLGPRDDLLRLNRAFDLVVSSSYSEGLPVVLGEAMAAGTPVVATDVGDCALLIADDDRVAPPRDPLALATAIQRVLELDEMSRRRLGERDRDRIRNHYSLEGMVRSYEKLYRTVAAK